MTAQTQDAPAAMFSPRRVGHANLFVGNLERSMHFYNKVAGFEEVFSEPGISAGFLSNGNTHHDLGLVECTDKELRGRDGHKTLSSGRATQPGLNHFGWEMETDGLLIAAYDRAVATDVEMRGLIDHQATHSIYLFDPDGFMQEYYSDVLKDWRSFFDDNAGQLISGRWDPHAAPALTHQGYPVDPEIRRVDEALIHPSRFTHGVLMTRRYDDMLAFHREVGGLDTAYESPAGDFVCLAGTHSGYAFDLALFRQAPDTQPSVHHYSYQVANEAESGAAEAAVEKAGIDVEKRIDNAAKRSFFIRDPDGLRCEFYVPRSPDLAAVASAEPELRPYLV